MKNIKYLLVCLIILSHFGYNFYTTETFANNSTTEENKNNNTTERVLDNFLQKIKELESGMSSEKYLIFLDNINGKITNLSGKYKNNQQILQMIHYLESGIKGIKEKFLTKNDVNNFTQSINNYIQDTKKEIEINKTNISNNTTSGENNSNIPSISTSENTPSITISGIPFKVENYDLKKSNYEYDYDGKKLKSHQLGITYDISFDGTFKDIGYTLSSLQFEDMCKAKGPKYRLPKTHELTHLYQLYSNIVNGQFNPIEHYSILRSDKNNSVSISKIYIPNFIPLDILPKIMKTTPIHNTRTISFDYDLGGYSGGNNFEMFLAKIRDSWILAKNDDNKYYASSYGYSKYGSTQEYKDYSGLNISEIICIMDK